MPSLRVVAQVRYCVKPICFHRTPRSRREIHPRRKRYGVALTFKRCCWRATYTATIRINSIVASHLLPRQSRSCLVASFTSVVGQHPHEQYEELPEKVSGKIWTPIGGSPSRDPLESSPIADPERWHGSRLFLFRLSCPAASAQYPADLPSSVGKPFFCRSFFWALLQANSCVRQLRGFCFPGSAPHTTWVPPTKQPLAATAVINNYSQPFASKTQAAGMSRRPAEVPPLSFRSGFA